MDLLRSTETIRILLILPQNRDNTTVTGSLRMIAAEMLTLLLLVFTSICQVISLLVALHVSFRGFIDALLREFNRYSFLFLSKFTPFLSIHEHRVLSVAIGRSLLSISCCRIFAPLLTGIPKTAIPSYNTLALLGTLQLFNERATNLRASHMSPTLPGITGYFLSPKVTLLLFLFQILISIFQNGPNLLQSILLHSYFIASALQATQSSMTDWAPLSAPRINLITDIAYSIIMTSGLLTLLATGQGATILLTIECFYCSLVAIMSMSKLIHAILNDIKVNRNFPRLSAVEVAGLADDDVCSVCLEPHTTSSCRLSCQHLVHRSCLVSVLHTSRRSNCPVCRAAIFSDPPVVAPVVAEPGVRRRRSWEDLMQMELVHRHTTTARGASGEGMRRTGTNAARLNSNGHSISSSVTRVPQPAAVVRPAPQQLPQQQVVEPVVVTTAPVVVAEVECPPPPIQSGSRGRNKRRREEAGAVTERGRDRGPRK